MTEQQKVTHTPEVMIDQATLGLPHDIRPMYAHLVRESDIVVGTLLGTTRRIVDIAGNNNPWDFRLLEAATSEVVKEWQLKQARLAANAIDNQNQ